MPADDSLKKGIFDEIRLFYHDYDGRPSVECSSLRDKITIKIDGTEYSYDCGDAMPRGTSTSNDRNLLRLMKSAVYRAMSEYTGRSFPWGSLTGIRPTKLAYEFLTDGGKTEDIARYLRQTFSVADKKAEIIAAVIENQRGYFIKDAAAVNFYIHIPFCPSRCSYCSFVSLDVNRNAAAVEPYVDALCAEIDATVRFLSQKNYSVYSVYIGGGTPAAIPLRQLKRILGRVPYRGIEYTLEAGRPETITPELVSLMLDSGVTRVSVNPQSFNAATLQRIGRGHSIEDVYRAFEYVSGKFTVNSDLIAGLPGETADDFAHSIDETAKLRPENVTVHTLSRKNGSVLMENAAEANVKVEDMVDYACHKLCEEGYSPYYLYRQKSTLDNLENIGYAEIGRQCVNNITVMEEFLSVAACGAGAINKRVYPGGGIARLANLRDTELYIKQLEERLKKKTDFF